MIAEAATRIAAHRRPAVVAGLLMLPFSLSPPIPPLPPAMNEDRVIAETVTWLERAVIGLNLCPFAKAVHVRKQIRYVVCTATTPAALCEALLVELQRLADCNADEIDTTLLIHPAVLNDFLDYNDFLDVADGALHDLRLEGNLQIASFHPHYQFAGTEPDDITNYTNRSPYPMLHLLREDSIDKAVEAFPEADAIFGANIQTLETLGQAGWDALGVGATAQPGTSA